MPVLGILPRKLARSGSCPILSDDSLGRAFLRFRRPDITGIKIALADQGLGRRRKTSRANDLHNPDDAKWVCRKCR